MWPPRTRHDQLISRNTSKHVLLYLITREFSYLLYFSVILRKESAQVLHSVPTVRLSFSFHSLVSLGFFRIRMERPKKEQAERKKIFFFNVDFNL